MSNNQIYKKSVEIFKKEGAVRVSVFGSHARDEQNIKSDLDILVKFSEKNRISLMDLVRIEFELEDALGMDVDLITEKSLHPYLKEIINSEKITIYEEK
jgi:hypothetical protein